MYDDNEGDLPAQKQQNLKVSLHVTTAKICQQFEQRQGVELSKTFTASLTETVWSAVALWAKDLESFAKHGKRTTITADDVLLLARRNPTLRQHLSEMEGLAAKKPLRKAKSTSKLPRLDTNSSTATTTTIESDAAEEESSSKQPVEKRRKIAKLTSDSSVDSVQILDEDD